MVTLLLVSGVVGAKLGSRYQLYAQCCQLSPYQSLVVGAKEALGLRFYSQMSQDKWVSEKVFPGVKNGFFLDVGSGDGTRMSNTKALEEKGWTGICIDAFPRNMKDRKCWVVKAVVAEESGRVVKVWDYDDWSGIVDTLQPLKTPLKEPMK